MDKNQDKKTSDKVKQIIKSWATAFLVMAAASILMLLFAVFILSHADLSIYEEEETIVPQENQGEVDKPLELDEWHQDKTEIEQAYYDNYDSIQTAKQALESGIIEYSPAELEVYSTMFDLTKPETALPKLMHLENGRCEKIEGEEVYLQYTFSDDTAVYFQMRLVEEVNVWVPQRVLSIYEKLREERELYLSRVTAKILQNVTDTWDLVDINDLTQQKEDYVILDQRREEDIVLYGLYGGEAMVLRHGDLIYILNDFWTSPRMIIPQIYYSDYDKDGVEEYALWTHMGTGTGVSFGQLYLYEPEGGELIEYQLPYEQFGRITSEYNEETMQLQLFVDGKEKGNKIDLKEFIEDYEVSYEDIHFGDFVSYEEKNGGWMMTAQAGIKVKDHVTLFYEIEIVMTAPIIYEGDGQFSLGEIELYFE